MYVCQAKFSFIRGFESFESDIVPSVRKRLSPHLAPAPIFRSAMSLKSAASALIIDSNRVLKNANAAFQHFNN